MKESEFLFIGLKGLGVYYLFRTIMWLQISTLYLGQSGNSISFVVSLSLNAAVVFTLLLGTRRIVRALADDADAAFHVLGPMGKTWYAWFLSALGMLLFVAYMPYLITYFFLGDDLSSVHPAHGAAGNLISLRRIIALVPVVVLVLVTRRLAMNKVMQESPAAILNTDGGGS